ncbi:hypothetical protein EV363DRAFT_1318191, partial [Boletus edulis]
HGRRNSPSACQARMTRKQPTCKIRSHFAAPALNPRYLLPVPFLSGYLSLALFVDLQYGVLTTNLWFPLLSCRSPFFNAPGALKPRQQRVTNHLASLWVDDNAVFSPRSTNLSSLMRMNHSSPNSYTKKKQTNFSKGVSSWSDSEKSDSAPLLSGDMGSLIDLGSTC